MYKQAGFSLIELMVVITIIGILASIVYANFGGSQKSARDAERQADLRMLQNAIAQYKQDNGRYPATGCSVGAAVWATEVNCPNDYISGLSPKYIAKLPKDPRRGNNPGYSYLTNDKGTVYKLIADRTVESEIVTFKHPLKRCDIRVGSNPDGSLIDGSTDREVVGWCATVSDSGNNLPDTCNASNDLFSKSYGVWGGFEKNTCSTSHPRCVGGTTAIICK